MGLTVLDAGVVIGFLDAADTHHGAAWAALEAAQARGDHIGLPVSAYAEAMVGPMRRGPDAVAALDRFVARLPITLLDLNPDIATEAARLRAAFGPRLRLPDALVVATARIHGSQRLLTTDKRWPTSRSLGLVVQTL